jgi:hypothetical protein
LDGKLGVHFEFLVLGAVKVKCSEVFHHRVAQKVSVMTTGVYSQVGRWATSLRGSADTSSAWTSQFSLHDMDFVVAVFLLVVVVDVVVVAFVVPSTHAKW